MRMTNRFAPALPVEPDMRRVHWLEAIRCPLEERMTQMLAHWGRLSPSPKLEEAWAPWPHGAHQIRWG